ncbi:TlpA disulfide reductase family protein [Pedobacter cryophilus]|uniref:AhpC/TSA family protein n=1 Tax=Pedobacter cryophilus TaxID=2571271 RepID=A0A4U1BUR4_9SPHI|nr:TlpA disulfide reductase family protein [Pedobacter cryophilus]TKB95992.1 AhpC/TSA family protein [Pedobacter cryophilus]
MRRILLVVLCFGIFVFNACKNKDEFVIKGIVENAGDAKKVYLLSADQTGQMVPVDSTFLDEDQKFVIKAKSLSPEFYQIQIGQRSYILIAENGNEIQLKANLTDPGSNYELTGSEESDKLTAYNKITSAYSMQTGMLAEKYSRMITKDQNNKDAIIAEFNQKSGEISKPFLEKSIQFIKDNKKSLTAFFAANIVMGMQDISGYENDIIAYSKEAVASYPNNKTIAFFAKQMEIAAKVAIGQPAPEIIALTPAGKSLKLSDYKGKYVLLDFWASWCAPCRQENPNIVKLYNLFKNKNFTVLGFSLDDNKDNWIKAITDDNLTWDHVSELKQWDAPTAQLYNISAIPASFIINPEGIIIAKNLRGEALNEFLKKNL